LIGQLLKKKMAKE